MEDRIEYKIAEMVKEEGGTTYYVGGYVRDSFLGIDNKDIDIEVHGINEKKLLSVLNKVGKSVSYGKQFGIYSLAGENIDIALPRTEKKTGEGHNDFEVIIDPNMDIETSIKRRDFTINAIYKNVLTEEIIDPFNGVEDIENKIIRHVDALTFVEDPLRVLRACQFAARFNFDIADETIALCKTIDISTLSKERVEEELKKALLKSEKPSIFFNYLKQMSQNDYWFKDVDLKFVDKANEYISDVENKYAYLLNALSIDTNLDITKFTSDKDTINCFTVTKKYINKQFKNNLSFYKVVGQLKDPVDFVYLRTSINKKDEELFDKLITYGKLIEKPCVTGKDLIASGMEAGPKFNEALKYANDLRLLGIEKEEALKIVLEFMKKDNV